MVAHFTLRTYDVNKVFFEKKSGFDDSFGVTKCLQHIENPDLVHMCAWLNEQPSNIKTMEISDIFHLGDEGKIPES